MATQQTQRPGRGQQQATPPAAAAAPAPAAVPTPQTDPNEIGSQAWLDRMRENAPDPWSPDGLIMQAIDYERMHGDLLQLQDDNREDLRKAHRRGILTPEQAEFVDVFYGLVKKQRTGSDRTKEQNEATRKARLAARKTTAAE